MELCRFQYSGPAAALKNRLILGENVESFHRRALTGKDSASGASWIITLGDTLLFDRRALSAVEASVATYQGEASELEFDLSVGEAACRDYYSHKPGSEARRVRLPITARRAGGGKTSRHACVINLSEHIHDIHTPAGLCPPFQMSLPRMLLTSYSSEFDVLFANQIAVISELLHRIERSPKSWLGGLLSWGALPWRRRAALAYRDVHPSAQVHPTAVIEGSIIEAGAQIGAHCTVRYSMVGQGAKLHDGAKVEFSVVGRNSWLMHDLVLYRCHVENDVFLIHGPYQFSGFQTGSAAFATIMMDYRPDAKPIKIETSDGLRPFGGRFLGAILREGARTLGGSMLAPGAVVPENVWLAADANQMHGPDLNNQLPRRQPVPPAK
jgi:hypothetical protein